MLLVHFAVHAVLASQHARVHLMPLKPVDTGPKGGTGDLQIPDLQTFLANIAHTLFDLGIFLCVIGIIVGGIMRGTAFGSERRIAASNVALSCAVLGFLIILMAQPLGTAIQKAFP